MLRARLACTAAILALAWFATGQAQTMTVDQVLDKWAQALGGREKLSAAHSTHTVAAAKTSGLTGTLNDYWSAGRTAFYMVLADGAVKVSGGCQGDTCWMKDMNGQARSQSGADLQAGITGLYFADNGQFFRDRFPASIGVGHSTDPGEIAVQITPKGGKLVTYFLDKTTFLPLRSETQNDDRKETTWFRDWRDVEGMKVAFETQQGTGDTLRDMILTVQQVDFNPTIPDSIFAAASGSVKDYAFTNGNLAKDIPFELVNNHIYVPVQVNGSRKLTFIFDSGAEMTCINKSVATELRIGTAGDLEGRGGGEKSISVSLAQGLTYDLPGVTVSNQIAAVVPFDQYEPIEGHKMDGVLGYDFISRFVVNLDYARKLLTLSEPKDFAYTGPAKPIDFELEGNLPVVPLEVTIAGCAPIKGRFMMDTGMRGALTVSSPTVTANNMIACATKSIQAPLDIGVGGQSKLRVTRAASVSIGDQTVTGLVVGLSQDTLGANASRNQNGSFGGEILRRFTVTFDYSRQQLFLEPNAAVTEPSEYDMAGLQLVLGENMKDEIHVMGVVPQSPADRAGLKKDDMIVAVDGQSLLGMKLWEVRSLFRSEPRKKVGVTYVRDGATKKTTITLERLI